MVIRMITYIHSTINTHCRVADIHLSDQQATSWAERVVIVSHICRRLFVAMAILQY